MSTLMRGQGLRRCAATLALGLAAAAAQAGLFDDEEARKAIIELRARVAQNDEAAKARSAEQAAAHKQLAEQMASQLTSQVNDNFTALRRSLLELNNQLEAMRGDIARLRGSDEQLLRDVAELQRQQKDIAQALDDRLRKLEPAKVTLDGSEFVATPEEKRGYEQAIATLREGDFDKSVAALASFQRRYPGSGYADSVRFWLGNALYGKRDYKEAVGAFRAFVAASPQHPRAPEAMLALANSQVEMKDGRSARKTLEDLMKAYPQSEAAVAGKERLASIK
ncbi:MAG: tol-pal system protein YbgF [Rubrivivax sp.]|nr:tol-pal system protein YbgF [Rubrivivax sp.]